MRRSLIEALETRTLLAGVTLVTHGRDGHLWGFVDTVVNDIINARLGGPAKASEYILTLTPDPNDGHLIPSIAHVSGTSTPANNPTGEILLEVNWTSVDTNASYHLDYIASVIRDYFINTPVDGVRLAELPLHEISISRGTGLCDEIARSLGQVGVWVDQETYCDPNPVEVMGDAPPTIYDNVAFVDDYWRSDGNPANTSTNGSPTDGAYNLNVWWLDQYHSGWALNHLLPGGYYVGTIDLTTTNGGEGPIYPQWYGTTPDKPARDQTGYLYSRVVGGARPLSGVWSASGGSGYRAPGFTPSGPQWPNMTDLAADGSSFSTSQSIPLSFIYQDRDGGATATFYLDPDNNPYNNNFALTMGSTQLASSASINNANFSASAGDAPSGNYYIAAKIADADGHYRFAYTRQISLINTTPPAAPSGLDATASVGKVSLSWTDNSSSETGFEIQRAADSSFSTNAQSFNVAQNQQTYDDTAVTSSTTYFYRVRATSGTLHSDWSNVKQITTPLWTANLSGSIATAASSYNLTDLGSADWAHWNGISADGTSPSMVHKSVGGSAPNLISNVSRYPSSNNLGHYGVFADTSSAEIRMNWNDGTPVASATNDSTKLWQNAATLGQGWTFSVPANTTTRTLSILAGDWNAGTTINAHLSDSSFPDYTYVDPGGSALVRKVYTITYSAASAGQSLVITLTKTANNAGHTDGSVDLLGAWLTVAATPPPTAPDAPELSAASDSGVSNSDGITNVQSPTFTGTAAPNSNVKIFADDVQVGGGSTDGGGSYSITSSALSDGVHHITATVTTAGGTSAPSAAMDITIDTSAPTLSSDAFNYQTRQNLTYDFSEDIAPLQIDSLTLANLTSSTTVASASMNLTYDASTHRATIDFAGVAGGILTNANYRATLSAAGVTDLAGNPLASDQVLDFFVLAGDANRDAKVDVTDLGILATNWQQTGKTFADGDFNYDGVVDVTDLGILATNWQSAIATTSASVAVSMGTDTTILQPH